MRLRLLSSLAAAAILLSGCAAFDPAAAVVGSRKIENDDFLQLFEFIQADPRFADQAPAANPEAQRQTLLRQVLSFLIQQQAIEEKAAEDGIRTDPERVDALFEQQIAQIGGEEALEQQLRASGATRQDVRDLLEAQVLRADVAQAVVEEEVSDDRLRAAYEERTREFTQVHASHILLTNEEDASRVAGQATPSNFARLARRFSEDQGSAQNGGDLGTRAAVEYVEPFANAVIEIPEGEVGGPVQSEFGYHVILVHNKETIPFEEARERLVQELAPEVFQGWMLGRLRSMTVRVNPRYGTFNHETGEVVARRSTTPLPGPQVTP